MVNITLQPLYSRERPVTHWTGGWVGPTAGQAVENLTPTGIRSLDLPTAYLAEYYRIEYQIMKTLQTDKKQGC